MKTPTQDDLDRFVRNNVYYCVSALVSTLAKGAGIVTLEPRGFQYVGSDYKDAARALNDLTEQALSLSTPVDDYEEAATQDACNHGDIEPYQREIYEHWIVSDYLADALERHGERVDKDFAGLTVWGRTTTGQGIAGDSVIEKIWRELHKEDAPA